MYLEKYLEVQGIRLKCVISSAHLDTHGAMQKLSEDEREEIRVNAGWLLNNTARKIMIAVEREKE